MSNPRGTCVLPIRLQDRAKLFKVLILPEIHHTLILGTDFWKSMGVIPNLRSNELTFCRYEDLASFESPLHLTPHQETTLSRFLDRHFQDSSETLGCTDVIKHRIVTDSPPIKSRYYPVSPVVQREIDKQLQQMLEQDVIEKSNSPWSSPILLVKKKDGTYRFCVDFRKLNAVTAKDSYPIPYVSHTLDKLRDSKYLTTLDIKSAYWQIKMADESKQFTAFTVPNRGLYQFKRLPFGLHNAPATFQRCIDLVIGHDLEPNVFVYLDDVIVVTKTFEEHVKILEDVLLRLGKAGFTLNRDKCKFCVPELKYLGYVVNENGLTVDPDKVQAIIDIPTPRTTKEIRRIIGMASWYRRFSPNFSTLMAPICALLRKNSKIQWTPHCDQAFDKLKELLVSAPILNCPDFDLSFSLQTDASDFGLGAVLTEMTSDGEKVICYISRSLEKRERAFSTTEKECLAVLWAIEKLRPYLEGIPFTVITDHHSLTWLHNLKDPHGRLARWAIRLQQYDFKILHRKGKEHVVPDTLSRSVPVVDPVEPPDTPSDTCDKWYLDLHRKIASRPARYPAFTIKDGKIFKYLKSSHVTVSNNGWKEVVPRERRKALLSEHHDSATAGHVGIAKTHSRLANLYYWPKMRQDVSRHVSKCKICLWVKTPNQAPAGLMLTPKPPGQPWENIATDIFGPLPRSTSGYSYILVVLDLFSKFPLLFPLRKATAPAVAKHLEDDVFLMFGAPSSIRCDNGSQFRSRELKNLAQKYGTKLSLNPRYHPQCNPSERTNRTMKAMIRATLASHADSNQRVWDKDLGKIACALRTSKSDTTGFTPYFVNFGREIILSGDQHQKPPPDKNQLSDPTKRSAALRQIYE
jgi:hypothetical protein